MKHCEFEISQFIDGELEGNLQRELFTHLAECSDCSNVLIEFQKLRKESKKFFEGINILQQDVVLSGDVRQKVNNKNYYKPLFYFFAAATIILGFLFLINQANGSDLKNQFERLRTNYADLQKDYKKKSEQKNVDLIGTKNTRPENITVKNTKGENKNKFRPIEERTGLKKPKIDTETNTKFNNVVYNPDIEPDDKDIQAIFTSYNGNDKNKKLKNQAINMFREEFKKFQYGDKLGTRDLLQRLTPYLRDGKIRVDTAKVRDLFLRYGKDKYLFKSLDEKQELDSIKQK
jgi:hypothetical protein